MLEDMKASVIPDRDILLLRIEKAEMEIRDDGEFVKRAKAEAEASTKGISLGLEGLALLFQATTSLEFQRAAIVRDLRRIENIRKSYNSLPPEEQRGSAASGAETAGEKTEAKTAESKAEEKTAEREAKEKPAAEQREKENQGKSAADQLLNPHGKLSRERIEALEKMYEPRGAADRPAGEAAILSRITAFKVEPEGEVTLGPGQSVRFKVIGYSKDGAEAHDLTQRMAWRVQRQGGASVRLYEPVFEADDYRPGVYLVWGTFGSYSREFVIRVNRL